MRTPGPNDGKPYGDCRMGAMVQAMVDKTVSTKYESVDFEIRRRQTLEDIVSPAKYLGRVTEALLDTDKILEAIAHEVKTEADKVMEVSSKPEDRIKRVA